MLRVAVVAHAGKSFGGGLSELRTVTIDQALSDAYSAKFRSLSDLENAWKYTI